MTNLIQSLVARQVSSRSRAREYSSKALSPFPSAQPMGRALCPGICIIIHGLICDNRLFGGMDTKKLFGANVKRYREEAGLSQEELGIRIGADQAYISRMESGQFNPTLDTIEQLSNALGRSVAEMFM